MGDEYVSVEHLFLSLLKHPNAEIKEAVCGIRTDAGALFAGSVHSTWQPACDKR